jgi:hypothetical protein
LIGLIPAARVKESAQFGGSILSMPAYQLQQYSIGVNTIKLILSFKKGRNALRPLMSIKYFDGEVIEFEKN